MSCFGGADQLARVPEAGPAQPCDTRRPRRRLGCHVDRSAFCTLNPLESRFSDGSWGVYYGADHLDTAAAEVSHHRSLFLARTREEAIDINLR